MSTPKYPVFLFPAYAGVIPTIAVFVMGMDAFPRLRGGDPHAVLSALENYTFSPPTRG